MLVIVAHHYVVNSGLIQLVSESPALKANDIFLLLFGWGGKTAINGFVLITGYFMCTSNITWKKFGKLLGERYFYAVIFFLVFWLTGYSAFSWKGFLQMLFPFFSVTTNFTTCFLLFYLFIPFLNKLLHTLNEKEHFILMGLCIFIYTVLPSFALASVSFNYVTWFCILYIIAAYLRLYPKKFFHNTKLWGTLSVLSICLSWGSVLTFTWLGRIIGREGITISYFFISDSNKILALLTGICCFMFFRNLHIKQSKVINTISASTFGVLLIHANSDTMRQWLWRDTLKNTTYYNSPMLAVHAIGSVLGVYMVCTGIDMVRIYVGKWIGKRRKIV